MLIGRLTAAAGLLAAVCGCGQTPGTGEVASQTATTSGGITNGTPTSGDLGVAALVTGGTLICTATLVAPRVLLTAAHCLPDGSMPDAVFGAAPLSGGTTLHVIAVLRHPSFDAAALTDDVAMALLDGAPPTGATPWPLPAAPLAASDVGLALRLVGFGLTAAGDTTPPQKRTGSAKLASLTTKTFGFMPSPSQTCSGDSGGPAFATIGGVETLVGVTSSGDPQCAQMATDMRVDAYASFIAPWLAATADGAAAAGQRCYDPANCASTAGTCAPALDDATLSFCAPACGAAGACPGGLQCLADAHGQKLCRHAPPSPGALGASCKVDADCASGPCVAPASGGSSVCSVTCFPDLPGFCQSGYDCAAVADADAGQSACFAPAPAKPSARPNGGCSASGTGQGTGGAALMLGLGALLVRRRASQRLRWRSCDRPREPRA